MKKAKILGLALSASLTTSLVHADVLITMKEASIFVGEDLAAAAAFLENGGDGKTVSLWSRENRLARVDANGRMIGKLDKGETYIINDKAKKCTLIKRDSAASSVTSDANPDFEKTGDSRNVGSWNADGYRLAVAGDNGDVTDVAVWVSDEATLGLDNYRAYMESVVTQDTAWMAKSLDLGGYPVRQEIHSGPVAMWVEIVSIEEQDPPAGTYEVPEGYTGCN